MSKEVKSPAPPSDLGERGQGFWKKLMSEFEWESASTELLVEVCRTLDRLELLNTVIGVEGVTAVGSAGQTVAHPALVEARQQQAILARLVSALELPESEEEQAEHEAWKTKRAKAGAAARHGFPRAVG